MTAIEILREARRLIAEVGWTKGCEAINLTGMGVDFHHPDAVAFCAYGGMLRASGARHWAETSSSAISIAEGALDDEAQARGFNYVTDYNDAPYRTREEVLALYDAAIARLAGDTTNGD